MAGQSVSFSEDDIRKWEAEATVHEARAAELRAKANAGRVFLGARSDVPPPSNASPTNNLRGEIVRIANESPDPLSKAEMRKKLAALGFPKSRLNGNYFYMAIKKVAEQGKITVLPDSRMWRHV